MGFGLGLAGGVLGCLAVVGIYYLWARKLPNATSPTQAEVHDAHR